MPMCPLTLQEEDGSAMLAVQSFPVDFTDQVTEALRCVHCGRSMG